jgi:hypothetical protein
MTNSERTLLLLIADALLSPSWPTLGRDLRHRIALARHALDAEAGAEASQDTPPPPTGNPPDA